MTNDIHDRLWRSAYYQWYNTAYNVELASRMVDRLKTVDDITKVLVALTASGSAIAGWALWSRPGFDLGWALLAGVGALLAIVHGSLGIPARLKDWLEVKQGFLGLRAALEAARSTMANHADFDPVELERCLSEAASKFAELEGRIPSDLFASNRVKSQCQDRIDSIVETNTLSLSGGAS